MRNHFVSTLCAAALLAMPVALVPGNAGATHEIGHAILGGIIGGVIGGVISNSVNNGQNHCHDGLGCHSHGGANQYHYHDAYGNVLYQQPVQPQRRVIIRQQPPAYQGGGQYSSAHYQWCSAKYRSYDLGSNSYQPYGAPRRYCRSPYGG